MSAVAYLRIDLDLEAPVVAATAGGDPNTLRTAQSLAGSMLRGAVAATLAARIDDDAADDPVFHRLILSGDVRWLSAYPVVGGEPGGTRALPAPVSLRRPKGAAKDDHRLIDLASASLAATPPSRGVGFVAPADPVAIVAVGVSTRIHHQRDRARGRPWTERAEGARDTAHGAIYSYESIDAGQRFAGFVQLRGEIEEIEALLRQHLPTRLLLGRSRRASYGGAVRVTVAERTQGREHDGTWSLDRGLEQGDVGRLLLSAPAIVRDPLSGQADPGVLVSIMRCALRGRADVTAFVSRTTVEGYNRHWGCPLPQEPAAAAGTVLIVRANDRIELEELLRIEHDGIGERRIDGCGRVVWLTAPQAHVDGVATTATRVPGDVSSRELSPLARRIDARIASDRRARAVAAAIGAVTVDDPPRASAAARLRVPLRSGASGVDVLRRLFGPVADGGLRDIAFDQLARCKVTFDGTPIALTDAIEMLLRKNGSGPAADWLRKQLKPGPGLVAPPQAAVEIEDDMLAIALDGLLARVQRAASGDLTA